MRFTALVYGDTEHAAVFVTRGVTCARVVEELEIMFECLTFRVTNGIQIAVDIKFTHTYICVCI